MRALGLQMDIAWEDRRANHANARRLLQRADLRGGELVVLPEMFASGFTMNVDAAADDGQESKQLLTQLAKEHRIHIVAGLVSRGSPGCGRNEAVVIGPAGGEVARY